MAWSRRKSGGVVTTIAPPPLAADDPRYPGRDPRYAHLTSAELPLTECLKDTVARFLPFWHETIAPEIRAGQQVLIAAHGNSLRALVKYLDHVSDDEIVGLNIPTGIPLVYELNDDLTPIHGIIIWAMPKPLPPPRPPWPTSSKRAGKPGRAGVSKYLVAPARRSFRHRRSCYELRRPVWLLHFNRHWWKQLWGSKRSSSVPRLYPRTANWTNPGSARGNCIRDLLKLQARNFRNRFPISESISRQRMCSASSFAFKCGKAVTRATSPLKFSA